MFGRVTQTIQIRANLAWQVYHDLSTGHFYGICVPLNLNASGDTWADFMASVSETIDLLLSDLFKTGEMDAFLREHGWSSIQPMPAPGTRARFEIPVFNWEEKKHFEDLQLQPA